MTFTESISTCFSKYVDFTGRASRSEFWWWTLFNFIVACVLSFIFTPIFGGSHGSSQFLGSLPTMIWGLIMLLPSLAVFCRRMHDTGRSGWWYFIGFIPLVGAIVLLVFECQPSQPMPNRYGNVPAGVYD